MAKYLFVYYGGMIANTPAKQKKSMDAWMGWFGKLGKAVVDMGTPTMPGKTVRSTGVRAVGKDSVTGYSIIKAASLDAAVAMAKGSPNVFEGGTVAVYETIPM